MTNSIDIVEGFKLLSTTINQTTIASVGLITISITIYEKIIKSGSDSVNKTIRLSWIFFLISIFFGLYAGHEISFYIISHQCDDNYLFYISLYSFLHFLFFLIGIFLIIVFGWKSFEKKKTLVNQNAENPDKNVTNFID